MDRQISNKTITCNDKHSPWITSKVKTAIKRNSRVYRKLVKLMHCCLVSVTNSKEQIINIINNFSSNKAHGNDGISVSMLKLCAAEVAFPLQIIFQDCINIVIVLDCWKDANVQPIHKKITVKL